MVKTLILPSNIIHSQTTKAAKTGAESDNIQQHQQRKQLNLRQIKFNQQQAASLDSSPESNSSNNTSLVADSVTCHSAMNKPPVFNLNADILGKGLSKLF